MKEHTPKRPTDERDTSTPNEERLELAFLIRPDATDEDLDRIADLVFERLFGEVD